ncbi:hypothetical protein QTJ16_003000 [Diplocarpon rosae]|uniref:Uncharacterized protein n=1 Tax=Diplocarpon rosae TaxID=946125 RepID=A0AAD9WGM8_9HELO|nr:hypothetical protein QTJ16_003000 [Diplocarpon rosae]
MIIHLLTVASNYTHPPLEPILLQQHSVQDHHTLFLHPTSFTAIIMQLIAVFSAAALISTVASIQPTKRELVKRDSRRNARWWSWAHNYDQSDVDPSENSGTYYPVPHTEAAVAASYSFPNSTSAAKASADPTAFSTTSPANSISTEFSTSTITSTITIGNITIGNTTKTLTILPATSAANNSSASNYTWTSLISSPSALPTFTRPNVTALPVNASAISNITTFPTVPLLLLTSSVALPATLQSSTLSTPSPSTITESSTADIISSVPISADPIFTAAPSAVLHPSTIVSQTTLVTEGQATGVPDAGALHCGVHGLPNGAYKMAEYWEDRRNVGVTLLGCYEFCEGANDGCFSYSFYTQDGTGAPRCDLFGGSVADSLDSIIPEVTRIWYDVGCGNPLLYSG